MSAAFWSFVRHPAVRWSARLAVGVLFIMAALGKMADPQEFVKEIANYKLTILPAWGLRPAAIIVPWIELISGLAVIFTPWHKEAGGVLSFLLLFFIVIGTSAIVHGLDISCGCFGTLGATKVGWLFMFRNVALLILALLAMVKAPSREPAHVLQPEVA